MKIFRPSDERLAKKLANHVYKQVRNNGIVRVEDVLALMAVIVAERCAELAKELPANKHDVKPHLVAFSEKIDEILVGPGVVKNWHELPQTCVFARIRNRMDTHFNQTCFPSLAGILKNYTLNVGKVEWGEHILNIPEDSKPSFSFSVGVNETRKFVEKHIHRETNQKTLTIAINAMSCVLIDTKIALNPSIALTMTFEIIYGLSKFEPHSCKKGI